MSPGSQSSQLTRLTEIGELSVKVRLAVKKTLFPLTGLLVAESGYLFIFGKPGAAAFAMMAAGSCIALGIWCTGAIGLPLLPMMVIQSLIIYGVPVIVGHENIQMYPPSFVLNAGEEVLIFNLAMILSWRAGMQVFHPSPPICYAVQEFNRSGVKGWSRLGFGMVAATTAFLMLQSLGLADPIVSLLPSGFSSILVALISVVSASGFFLISMMIGGGEASAVGKFLFWLLLIVNGLMSASELLLYSAAANLITVAIGIFWGRGRVPWRYLLGSVLVLSFLNTGKTTMRERHWRPDQDEQISTTSLRNMPSLFSEWTEVSYDAILENRTAQDANSREDHGRGDNSTANKNQTLLDRIDNLQNLLYVIDAVEAGHVPPLHGATYALIPPLLVPRILAPNKPRSHEGQVMLNVHFGRQNLSATFDTYIAWGLLPEAYGNFGAVAGSIFLGLVFGIFFSWVENLTARKLVVSTEGFLSLSLLMGLMNSFEMVASVLVTSIYQSFIIIAVASMPFVRRTVIRRPTPTDA